LKFGTSVEVVHQISIDKTITKKNDQLGEAVINFPDPIVFGKGRNWDEIIDPRDGSIRRYEAAPNFNKKYQTGLFRLYVAPKKTN